MTEATLHKFQRFLIKVTVFLYRKILLGLTWARRYPDTDPLQILLDLQTSAQKKAYESLRQHPNPVPKRVAIVIPFRDKWQLTKNCLEGLVRQDLGQHTVVAILVDNGSTEAATKQGMKKYAGSSYPSGLTFQCITDNSPFNFSSLVNNAVKDLSADEFDDLILLNNDIEFVNYTSIRQLIDFAGSTDNCGAVGTTLLYPNRRIQHLFVAPGVAIMGAHPFSGSKWPPESNWQKLPRPVPAVTGACMLISLRKFFAVGGLDENLPHSGQDVDFCLKLQKAGYVNWTVSHEFLIHHESASRSKALSLKDSEYLYQKWGTFLTQNPFYHQDLSRWSERPVVSLGEGAFPWRAYCQ